ncbi:MAG: FAD-binding domain-containing protein, partial [Acidilobaceae archaeon]|nr:FAD-binding domain-containing protein [Acidilobaceae archaeon]
GIRQLKSEFWIHNRVRLVVANFLVKDLHVDWRIGEDFFREYLVDYDEVLNAGNWQWSASVGVDPVPIRVFNPIKQVEKYDPDCAYVK